jgi:two-component system, response regulator PdtaR
MTETVTNNFSILIADDDPGCRETLREIITPIGYPTIVAEDGETALEMLERQPVHLFLCDMYMRSLNGLETIHLARTIVSELPCILITASSDETIVRKALEVKIYSVMNKPIQRQELVFTLQRALRRAYPREIPQSSN